jgi:hypothetical protein
MKKVKIPKFCKRIRELEKDEDFLTDMCVSYRHDFGLVGAEEQKNIIFTIKEVLRALENNLFARGE